MGKFSVPVFVLTLGLSAIPASADIIPEATITARAEGALYDYTITLTNSAASTDVIGTFWYSWIPGKDFLPTRPIDGDFITPTEWHLTVTHSTSATADGFALRWEANSPDWALAPGESLTFGFTSADTPAQIFGLSPFYPDIPVNTAFVYHAAPFSDAGVRLAVNAVPEPASMSLVGLGGLGLLAAYRRQARSNAVQT